MKAYRSMVLVSSDPESIEKGANEVYQALQSEIKAFGLDYVTGLCDRLLQGGAPGLHFYTLNQAGPTTTIWQRLGLN